MAQVAFQRVGDEHPWKMERTSSADAIYTRNPTTINWTTGSPDTIAGHLSVKVYPGGTSLPDASSGMVFIIFTIQGTGVWYAATIDNAADMDTLVGADTVWGIAFWWDGTAQPEDWTQY